MKRANLNKRYGNGITKTKKLTLLSASRYCGQKSVPTDSLVSSEGRRERPGW